MKGAPPTSFRDPEGFCCEVDGRIFRKIFSEAAPRVEEFLAGTFFRKLMADGDFPPTQLLQGREAEEALEKSGLSPLPGGLLLEHRRIPFPSYPHEWCPEMLFAAGALTLRLQTSALAAGLNLKDATPDNILFDQARPVFVDLLSFERTRPGAVLWPAYAQFVRTFLLPLLLNRRSKTTLTEVFLARRDGLEPEEVYDRCSWPGRFAPAIFAYATLPAWFSRGGPAPRSKLRAQDRPQDEERARFMALSVVRRLERTFQKSAAPSARNSKWSNYAQDNSYPPEAQAAKEKFVRGALEEIKPRRVLDVGCNTGHFSRLAAAAGAEVVAIDLDPAAVGRVWDQARTGRQSILPLVVNLARPSAGLGWRNREQKSFLDRAQNNFDLVLLLAVVHHLAITDGIPLEELFRLMHGLGPSSLIVEKPGPEDRMVLDLSANKEHLPARLGEAAFQRAFAPFFDLVRSERIPGMDRTLFRLARRN